MIQYSSLLKKYIKIVFDFFKRFGYVQHRDVMLTLQCHSSAVLWLFYRLIKLEGFSSHVTCVMLLQQGQPTKKT